LLLFGIKIEQNWSAFDDLSNLNQALYGLVIANLALYALEAVFYIVKGKLLTYQNMKTFNRLELLSIFGNVIGIWGLILVFSKEVQNFVNTSRNDQVYQLNLLMTWMFFFRILTLMFVACLLSCYCILVCCLICLCRR